MTSPNTASVLGPEFNDFLFAMIGEYKNGMPLSVLSALTRLEIDPWREAVQLTGLPEETAVQRMVSLIVALPNGPWVHPATIAARLIALLPSGTHKRSCQTSPGVSLVSGFQVSMYVIFVVLFT